MLRFASEDVGLADPYALNQVAAAFSSHEVLGMPEGALALAQAAVYLALAPKSNALYTAYGAASRDARGPRALAGAHDHPQRPHPADERPGLFPWL